MQLQEGILGGKIAVVTGAASGIGRAMAHRFAAEGMKVAMADVDEAALTAAAETLAGEVGEENVVAIPTDVRDPEAVDALAAATFEQFGTAHVVCNNAGVAVGGFSWEVAPDRWRWIVEVNLLGVANGVRSFVPRLIEQGEGHVVNTASAAGLLTGPGVGPYFATKHAVVALSESLWFDLQITGNAGVGVSVLCPEWVRTQIHDSERNRPADVAPEETDRPDRTAGPVDIRAAVEGLVDTGIAPDEVAAKVLDGIRAGRFWIFTHDSTVPAARKRWDAIESGGVPAMWLGRPPDPDDG
jgi:NAD(P)-dependent dehydrogenase (short-subunit alcohol dehydrogenase family)